MKYVNLKNVLDKIFASIFLILFSPIIILCLLLVLIEDPHSSPLFSQKRIGYNNKEFKIFKIRTMRNITKMDGKKLSDRERMLKTGFILRKLSLDELPQLINIIIGQMSFIGPRPLPTKYLPYYSEFEKQRHNVKPGISGLAQINGRNNINWEDKFEFDIDYVEKLSLLLDMKILIMTFVKVIKRSDVQVRGEGLEMDFHEYRKLQWAKKSQ